MPRPRRSIPPDSIVHILNRGNDRRLLFADERDFEQFLSFVFSAKMRIPTRIVAYSVMPNHWHFVIWAYSSTQVSRFMHRLTSAHAARVRAETGTVGQGHVYQGRFRAFLVDGEQHYFRLIRYVEGNPIRAGLARRAEEWPWSSLRERTGRPRGLVEAGPLRLPNGWPKLVNELMPAVELEEFHAKLLRSHVGPWDRPSRRRRKI